MPRTPKVLVIGLDGALLSRIEDAGAPHLAALMAAGLTAPSRIEPHAPTLSGPGWATVLTGVWPDKHHVRDNTFSGGRFAEYPDFLSRVSTAAPGLNTCAVTSWAPLAETVFSAKVGTRVATPRAEYDAGTTSRVVAELRGGAPDALFVQLDGIDQAGHEHGAASRQYLEAIRGADAHVGQLVAAVGARPADEDWLVMVTADHGHTDTGGHGGPSPQESRTFLIAVGGGLPPGSVRDDVRMPDVAACALAHLGIALDPAWGLDGRPLHTPSATRRTTGYGSATAD
ncbi:alkaline phosphatase family protein [Streptomyces sp. KHY 26]|uniref:alkaline phosphatase family protein n=1 Tax=Streptomyces sp. KHY 26 TaxID=3097359 RepID=UPI00376EEEB2